MPKLKDEDRPKAGRLWSGWKGRREVGVGCRVRIRSMRRAFVRREYLEGDDGNKKKRRREREVKKKRHLLFLISFRTHINTALKKTR